MIVSIAHPNLVLTEAIPMLTVLSHVKVQSYAKWRPVFDDLNTLRQAHGLISERVLRNASNPNDVFIEMDFREAIQARAYMSSPELRAGMQKAGVIPPPEVNYLEEAPIVAQFSPFTETVRAVTSAIEAQNWDAALAMLSDDFKFSGATPVPLTGEQWIGIHRALGAAMPNLSFNYAPTKSNGSHTVGTVKITGTHRGEFNLPMPGFPRVSATGNAIANPTECVEVTVDDGKITEWQVESVTGGGLPGILAQMGVSLPNA